MGTEGEVVESAREVGGTQYRENLILVRKGAVVAAMIRQNHVDNRTGTEDDDRGNKDWQPERSKVNHARLRELYELNRMTGVRLTPEGSGVKRDK
jgi:hypothetical protein